MRTHDGRINHLQCRVGQAAAGERLQHHIPDATVSPAAELPKNRIPVAELLRQIAPRRAGPHQPKRRVHHTAMVARRTASATDQKRFEIRPLIIGQQSANQGCPPQRAALNQFSIPASIDLSTRPSETTTSRICTISFDLLDGSAEPTRIASASCIDERGAQRSTGFNSASAYSFRENAHFWFFLRAQHGAVFHMPLPRTEPCIMVERQT